MVRGAHFNHNIMFNQVVLFVIFCLSIWNSKWLLNAHQLERFVIIHFIHWICQRENCLFRGAFFIAFEKSIKNALTVKLYFKIASLSDSQLKINLLDILSPKNASLLSWKCELNWVIHKIVVFRKIFFLSFCLVPKHKQIRLPDNENTYKHYWKTALFPSIFAASFFFVLCLQTFYERRIVIAAHKNRMMKEAVFLSLNGLVWQVFQRVHFGEMKYIFLIKIERLQLWTKGKWTL